jgi:threonine dehydrogenase-like Zn-dependent dehydrogenase
MRPIFAGQHNIPCRLVRRNPACEIHITRQVACCPVVERAKSEPQHDAAVNVIHNRDPQIRSSFDISGGQHLHRDLGSHLAHESEVLKIPGDMTDDQAVLAEPASVALRAVLRAKPEPGQHVLVIGCGIIGLLVVGITRIVAPEAHITAMARHPQQIEMARRLGADQVIAGGDGYREAADVTGAQLYTGALGNRMLLGGYDVIYDIVGSGQTIKDSLRWARAGGRVMVVGISLKLVKTDLSPVWHQEVTLMGSLVHGIEDWDGQKIRGYDLVMSWMRDGLLPTDGLITHRFPLADYKQAVATATNKRTGAIKVLLQMPQP